MLVLALGAYFAARETSAFALERVDVTGAPPSVAREVRRAVAPLEGSSLLALDGAALERRVEALPTVVTVAYDRDFPHTLHLRVWPETPAAVVRRGSEAWLVSARARVIRRIPRSARPGLGRIWLKKSVPVEPGVVLEPATGGATARALALARRFPARIETASLTSGFLAFRLRSGLELRLGEPTDVRLKLAIARRALHALPVATTYLDVSVPGRPVAGDNPRLSGGG